MKPIQVCNGEVTHDDEVCEQCKFYYPAPEVDRLVEAAKTRLLTLEILLRKRGLNEPEYSEYDCLNAILAPFVEVK